MKVKFSIVTVVYNGSSCIKKTIESVINQTYKNYEYIIIDGNSKDNTIDICKQYEDKITKIISEPDNGLYDAMNKGIENASGDYIIFMNCDDTFYNNEVLEKVATQIEKNEYPDFVYGDAIDVSEDETQEFLKKSRSHKMIWYGMFTHHQAMFYKLKLIKKYNIKYKLKYKIAADYAFTAQFFKCAKSFLYLNLVVCKFKEGGISNKNYDSTFVELVEIKHNIIGLPIFIIKFILSFQKSMIFIKKNFSFIYNLLRYRRI